MTLGLVAAAAALAALALALGLGQRDPAYVPLERIAERAGEAPQPGSADPLAWDPARRERFEARATLALSHVLYAKSPGGVLASAERTARWRAEIEAAANDHGVDPDMLEAMVLLESAGRPEVSAGPTPESAAGLAQILPSTATDLLGMEVDLAASIRLTEQIEAAGRRDRPEEVRRLARRRAEVDERFDPRLALAGAARYLQIAGERFGSDELAVVSYHMGIGNLESVIAAYTGEEVGEDGAQELVESLGLSYAQLYFDTSPERNRAAWEILNGLGDDSATYLWRVFAARRVMERWRSDRELLERLAELATAKATLEEVFHPEDRTEVFESPDEVSDALDDGELATLPSKPRLGFEASSQLGELAEELDVSRGLYLSLRPEALAALTFLAAKVRAISGERRPLRVTSAVRDRAYQELLVGVNPEATPEYSLHTTGWSFDILREYGSPRQAAAFQFVLDRMSALALIDYAVEPRAIHITASEFAAELLEG